MQAPSFTTTRLQSTNTAEDPVSHGQRHGTMPIAMMGQQQASKPVSPQPPPAGALGIVEPQRTLPDRNVTSGTIEDAYVQFILYCNPYLPATVDVTELRRGFHAMPKTDGRSFEPFPLYELIRKLEAHEIETWGQLVMELGVKPPDVASGQSTQKVQQYAVRLKRWLHAYHIDAFFQYCLNKTNPYFTEIQQVTEPSEAMIRDGVPPEEDLALRALVPKWRPKRGRRPLDDGADGSPQAKRQMRATSLTADEQLTSALPMSAYPQSASPWDRHSNSTDFWLTAPRSLAPRAEQPTSQPTTTSSQPSAKGAAQLSPPQVHNQPVPSIESQLSFYIDQGDTDPSGGSGLPHSAVHTRAPHSAYPRGTTPTPQSAAPHSAHPAYGSPAGASTASGSKRPRKRHNGVSAAWAPDSTPGSKPRGRPPAHRITQDGMYGMFPARDAGAAATPLSAAPPSATTLHPPSASTLHPPPATTHPPHTAATRSLPPPSQPPLQPQSQSQPQPQPQPSPSSSTAARKPSKLQLQVPQHEGGPVRLATPPRVAAPPDGSGTAARRRTGRAVRGTSIEFFTRRDEEDEIEAALREEADDDDEGDEVDWKRKALALRRRVLELERELKNMKRRVMEAVM